MMPGRPADSDVGALGMADAAHPDDTNPLNTNDDFAVLLDIAMHDALARADLAEVCPNGLTMTPALFDFQTLPVGQMRLAEISLHNTSAFPMVIHSARIVGATRPSCPTAEF